MSKFPKFNTEGPRGYYDQKILDEAIPEPVHETLLEDLDLDSEEARAMIWKDFENGPKYMADIRENWAPVSGCMKDAYNPIHIKWNNRGYGGMDNNTRMKEMFVETERWVEDVIGLPKRISKQEKMYKGTTKKW